MLFYFIGQPVGKQGDLKSIHKLNALNYHIFLLHQITKYNEKPPSRQKLKLFKDMGKMLGIDKNLKIYFSFFCEDV